MRIVKAVLQPGNEQPLLRGVLSVVWCRAARHGFGDQPCRVHASQREDP
jgi:hypothetical protein